MPLQLPEPQTLVDDLVFFGRLGGVRPTTVNPEVVLHDLPVLFRVFAHKEEVQERANREHRRVKTTNIAKKNHGRIDVPLVDLD